MIASVALQMQGWSLCDMSDAAITELLGASARRIELTLVPGVWRVEDALGQTQPIGPIGSLIRFESTEQSEIHVIPGSQGQEAPPGEVGHALTRQTVEPGRSLIIDARCWFRVPSCQGLSAQMWVLQPRARDS